jgi:hypothetical protein
MMLDHLLPLIEAQSLMEWTCTSLQQPLAEFYTILPEGRHQIILEMFEAEHVSKTDQSGLMTFKSGDCAGQRRC